MLKVTVLYGHPASPDEFERYYAATHLPIAHTIRGVARWEFTRFAPGPDGAPPAFYRMAEAWFDSPAAMQAALGSPEGQATVADLANFATGGITFLVGAVDAAVAP